jgi:hypothetical protein
MSRSEPPTPPQLIPGHPVRGGITEVITCQSRWLFDLAARRYLRCGHWEDVEAAMRFGEWQTFEHVSVPDGTHLEVKGAGRPAVRTTIHDERCACGSVGESSVHPRTPVEAR